jgi:predicted transcriptional regulator
MKLLSLRLDDFLVELIEREAKKKRSTKVEIIRAALMNYFMNLKDTQDIALAESRLDEDDLPFDEAF